MPRLDGIALYQAVCADPKLATPQFIVLRSRFAGAQREVEALEAGVDCLTGPCEPPELLARVKAGLREL